MALKEVLEAWRGEKLDEMLRKMYIDEDMSIREIGKELKISFGVVHKYLHEYGISKHTNLF